MQVSFSGKHQIGEAKIGPNLEIVCSGLWKGILRCRKARRIVLHVAIQRL